MRRNGAAATDVRRPNNSSDRAVLSLVRRVAGVRKVGPRRDGTIDRVPRLLTRSDQFRVEIRTEDPAHLWESHGRMGGHEAEACEGANEAERRHTAQISTK